MGARQVERESSGMAMGYVIEQDVPCVSCGYDLRGLDRDGRCPECSAEIVPSLRAWQKRTRGSPSIQLAERRWLLTVAQGSAAAVVTFAVMMILAVVWGNLLLWISLAPVAWALSWLGSWLVTARPPEVWQPRVRLALRWTATAYVVFPLFVLPWTWRVELAPLAMISVVSGLIAGCLWFFHLSELARRCRSASLVIEARILMVLIVPLMCGGLMSRDVFTFTQFGSIDLKSQQLRRLHHADAREIVILVAVIGLAIWSASISLRLAIMLFSAARKKRNAAS